LEQKVEELEQETRRLSKELESEKVVMKSLLHSILIMFWYKGVFIEIMSSYTQVSC